MTSIIKLPRAPRRLARDASEGRPQSFAPAEEYFEKGIDTLANFLSEHISSEELESLREELRLIIHRRTIETVQSAMDSSRRFFERFPDARRLKY